MTSEYGNYSKKPQKESKRKIAKEARKLKKRGILYKSKYLKASSL